MRPYQPGCIVRQLFEAVEGVAVLGLAGIALVVGDHGEVAGKRVHQAEEHRVVRFGAMNQHEQGSLAGLAIGRADSIEIDEGDLHRGGLHCGRSKVSSIFDPAGSRRKICCSGHPGTGSSS